MVRQGIPKLQNEARPWCGRHGSATGIFLLESHRLVCTFKWGNRPSPSENSKMRFRSLWFPCGIVYWHAFIWPGDLRLTLPPSCKHMLQVAALRVTSQCKFLIRILQQPLWLLVSASYLLPFLNPLDKTTMWLTKIFLFWFELIILASSWEP